MLLLSILLALLPAHDYHVSKTNVRYVADKNQVQVEMHLFVEDLEKDMMASGAPEALEIGTKRQHEDAERYLLSYLEKHFTVNWNGLDLPLEVVGYELADDLHGLWIYQLADVAGPPAEVVLKSTLLTGTYADQKNIVKLYNGTERSATLLMSKDQTTARY
ncbi:DUF6702 family protein [Neolewinella persica]|uniref:DUF6702 family protein n=1 Tax=Neolewinella persica TaxID=70998 RepID=UPI000369DFC0|nr:DUF6702 family protein [Neolewinella persica]